MIFAKPSPGQSPRLPRGLLLLAGVALGCISAPAAAGPRPLSDFLDAQGTYCLDLDGNPDTCEQIDPPYDNIIGWLGPRPTFDQLIGVDCTGVFGRELDRRGIVLGTTLTGEINERKLPDGRAEVSVKLHTKNALALVLQLNPDGSVGEAVFGSHHVDVALRGAKPAVGDCQLLLRFINSAPDAPLLDLIELLNFPPPGTAMLALNMRATAEGDLPDGRRAKMVTSQTAQYGLPPDDLGYGRYPAEVLEIIPLGR